MYARPGQGDVRILFPASVFVVKTRLGVGLGGIERSKYQSHGSESRCIHTESDEMPRFSCFPTFSRWIDGSDQDMAWV